jgi:hypothetical protein
MRQSFQSQWGVKSAENAQDLGYQDAGVSMSAEEPEPTQEYTPPPEGYQEALGGNGEVEGDAGCFGEIEKELYAGLTEEEMQAAAGFDVWTEVGDSAKADPGFSDVKEAWSACMAEDGYTYAAPNEPYEKFNGITVNADGSSMSEASGGDEARPTPEEVRTAAADAACKEKVKFWEEWDNALFRAQETYVEAKRPQLERMRDLQAKFVANAHKIIADAEE